MNKQDIQTVLDALKTSAHYSIDHLDEIDFARACLNKLLGYKPLGPLTGEDSYSERREAAITICEAALAEPSEAVAWMKAGEGDYEKAFSWNFSEKTGYTIPLYPQPTTNHLDEIAKVLHYPECWDTAAYPTLEDAIIEAKSWAHCTNEDCQCPTKEAR